MKIYTKTGDQGQTGLIGGRRVSKASMRIEAYGTVDELNAALGVALSLAPRWTWAQALRSLQGELHLACADLADPNLASDTPRLKAKHVAGLEAVCDRLQAGLPPLKRFILPGGSQLGAQLHLARTVARRAERRTIELGAAEALNNELVKYLNRLSDALFLLARQANFEQGEAETHPDYG